ncbi:MAG: alpha/beta hydrolase [Sphingomonadales bacterium]|nr:alpha/beta hydrolase [Sphingomonadales bacterium]
MRRLLALALSMLTAFAQPAMAQTIVYETVEVVEEEELPAEPSANERFVVSPSAAVPRGIAAFGPFRVLDQGHAALVDATDERTPAQFAAMVRAYPGLTTLELVECPGTEDDRANLRLGRMIHARGMATHVPDGGSVRSGGVELFLAGSRHTAEKGAEFAVHSWADEDGREAKDYPANAPENLAYLVYYREMGMSPAQAAAFYAMTNSVPNAQAKWLTAADMGRWVAVN